MAKFRVVLLGESGRVVGGSMILALWSGEALELAERIAREAAPDCSGYEVWRGNAKIARRDLSSVQ